MVIRAVIEGAMAIIRIAIEGFLQSITTVWGYAWSAIKNLASSAWEGIKWVWDAIINSLSAAWDWLIDKAKNSFNVIKNTIVGAFTVVGNVVEGIWDGIKTTIKNSINFIISTINLLIKGIKGINSIKISIPEVNIPLIGKVGGGTIGFPQIPEIPMLAKGGEIAKPTLAMMGERNRKEVVLPLQDSSVWDMMASTVGTAVLNAMQFSQPQQGSQTQGQAVFNIDGTQFARAIIPLINKEQARQGTMAIQGV
jgi:phage-related protein